MDVTVWKIFTTVFFLGQILPVGVAVWPLLRSLVWGFVRVFAL
jgi:hypothetical protein